MVLNRSTDSYCVAGDFSRHHSIYPPRSKVGSLGAEKALPQLKVEQIQGSLFPRFALHNVSFVDESLHVDAKVESLTLAMNFRCFFDPKVCVDELALQGVNFQMPELPPQVMSRKKKHHRCAPSAHQCQSSSIKSALTTLT